MLCGLGLFPTRAKARNRLTRLVARKRIRFVGTVNRGLGRPEHAYCRWRPKIDSLVHELELTELCLRLDGERLLRGPHVTDTTIRPDAQVWINGREYLVELDRGSMGAAQMAGRFRLYEPCSRFVLWICPTAARRDALRAQADGLRSIALFTTFDEAMISPHAPIWLDCDGQVASLPRQQTTRSVTDVRQEPP